MPFFDLPVDQLEVYSPPRHEPADFDAFWASTLVAARQHSLDARFTPVDYKLRTVETFDVTFNGYGGQPIKGWFSIPAQRPSGAKLPCIVEFIGYGGGRAFPTDWLLWPSAGYAHLVMDTRGQGSSWSPGDTPDIESEGASPQYPGFMTRGIASKETYYYRRLFTDAVRAIEAAQSHPAVDPDRIAVTGGSQGGGISIAAAGLAPETVKLLLPDVPFLCHYRRATTIIDTHPYAEIALYLKAHRDHVESVFHTLDYFDGINFAARVKARSLFSVALMDDICPPSTVYAAYNALTVQKEIRVYPFNLHEGGGTFQTIQKLNFVKAIWE